MLASHPSVSSRGELLMKRFLSCDGVPTPPAGDRIHPANATSLASRQELNTKLSNAVCKGCHALMEVGFVLHGFDERGLERTLDSDEQRLDTNVKQPFFLSNVANLSELASVLEENGTWKSCLGQALIETAALRMKSMNGTLPELGAGEEACAPGNILADTLRAAAPLDSAMNVVATMIFGGEVLTAGTNNVQNPPPLGVKPLPTVPGRLSACLPIIKQEILCAELCQQDASSCTDELITCRLAGKNGRAFFFSSKVGCEAEQGQTALSANCAEDLRGAACDSTTALSSVRCCCDGLASATRSN